MLQIFRLNHWFLMLVMFFGVECYLTILIFCFFGWLYSLRVVRFLLYGCRIMSLVECCLLGLGMFEWLIILCRGHSYLSILFDVFLNCLNCPFDLSIAFGSVWTWDGIFKVPLFRESFECICCEFWAIVWDDYFGYSIFRKKVFRMYYYRGGEFIWQLTDIEEVQKLVV